MCNFVQKVSQSSNKLSNTHTHTQKLSLTHTHLLFHSVSGSLRTLGQLLYSNVLFIWRIVCGCGCVCESERDWDRGCVCVCTRSKLKSVYVCLNVHARVCVWGGAAFRSKQQVNWGQVKSKEKARQKSESQHTHTQSSKSIIINSGWLSSLAQHILKHMVRRTFSVICQYVCVLSILVDVCVFSLLGCKVARVHFEPKNARCSNNHLVAPNVTFWATWISMCKKTNDYNAMTKLLPYLFIILVVKCTLVTFGDNLRSQNAFSWAFCPDFEHKMQFRDSEFMTLGEHFVQECQACP